MRRLVSVKRAREGRKNVQIARHRGDVTKGEGVRFHTSRTGREFTRNAPKRV